MNTPTDTKTKVDIISKLLQKHALTPPGEVNMRAWEVFVRAAEFDKIWAKNATREFLCASCDLTRQMAEKYRQTPTLVLAAQHYAYSHYRGHARTGIYWIDPTAKKLWDSFETTEME